LEEHAACIFRVEGVVVVNSELSRLHVSFDYIGRLQGMWPIRIMEGGIGTGTQFGPLGTVRNCEQQGHYKQPFSVPGMKNLNKIQRAQVRECHLKRTQKYPVLEENCFLSCRAAMTSVV
jgi:hypothetical protein